jgi:aspartyl-tRNA(Asn)/glutamyl-tRNA(Gln) amidotransferase subunit A
LSNSFKGYTLAEAGKELKQKHISSQELTLQYLDRIEATDNRLKAFVTVTKDKALEQARQADERLAADTSLSPLTGIPMLIKDVICTKGVKTTCSSKMLVDFTPTYDAAVIERLNKAGAVMLGKANMDEFAMGSSTENSAFFTTANPWDLKRVPGGSSGGAAAGVAASQTVFALGSDTGGSIRQPASFCGVTGMKPTYGRVSRYGLIAFASSLDQIGPLTKDAYDCAVVLNAISGFDDRDSNSSPQKAADFTANLNGDIKGLKIGVPKEYFPEGVHPNVTRAVKDAFKVLEENGAVVDLDVSLPHTPYALAVYYIIAPSEASTNLARFDGVKYGFSAQDAASVIEATEKTRQQGFGDEVKRRIMIGTYALSAGYYDAWYKKAQQVRTLIRREFDQAFSKYDVLVTPTTPTTAFNIGEKTDDPYQMYLSDICTIPVNIAGLPAISLPCGFNDGLPIGLQIIGKPFNEDAVLRTAYAYQQATNWHTKTPTF